MTWNPALIDGPISIASDPTGYHLNVAPTVMTPALEPYRIVPATPERVFESASTVFLRFTSEAEARSLLSAYWIEGGST